MTVIPSPAPRRSRSPSSVIVADTWNDRVQKFAPDGEFLTKWGRRGPGNGSFQTPSGIAVDGATVGELLADLTRRYEGLRKHLYADDGRLRNFVNVYLNDEDIRYLQREQTPVKPGDSLSIVPSVAGGAPTVTVPAAPDLSQDEIKRYSRHLIMPEVGVEGQEKLKKGSVLCIGAGGLGSPAALYLAAAGVGTIGIVDFDVVDYSNLQRQVIHGTSDVGRSKLASAKDRLLDLNPNINVETYETALSSKNALELFKQFGLQLLIVAPLDAKARVTQPYVGCYLHVAKRDNRSHVLQMSAREFDETGERAANANPVPVSSGPRQATILTHQA